MLEMSEIYQQRLNDAHNRWAGEYTQFKTSNWNDLSAQQQAEISRLRKNEIANMEANEQARQARQARFEQEKTAKDNERNEREAAQRKQAADELKANLRVAFLQASPSASEEDFERLLPELLDDHYKREAAARFGQQIEAERSRYGAM